MRKLAPVAIAVLAFTIWATSWAGASPSPGKASIGVADRKAVKPVKGVPYDDLGLHLEARASWGIKKQWKWPLDPPVGVLGFCILNGTADIAGSEENVAIEEALDLWDKYEERLAFTKDCNAPQVTFKWATGNHGDADPFDGKGGTLAHAAYPMAGWAHFDDDEDWTLEERKTPKQPLDLLTAAAHEIGHVLGLEHSTDGGSIMQENYEGSHFYLGVDDLEGLAELFKSLTD
jgi:Matrixin